MSRLNIKEIHEENKVIEVLERNKVKDDTISHVNNLLEINQNLIFDELLKMKQIWRKIYLSYWKDLKTKKLILSNILNNIYLLLNKPNIKRVYNSTTSIDLENNNLSLEEELWLYLRVEWESIYNQNTLWGSCNNWIIWVYNIIKDITLNDDNIKYDFQLNKNDNHWVLYITLWDEKFIFESRNKELFLGKKDKSKSNIFHNGYKNISTYKKAVVNWSYAKNAITYHFDLMKLKIVKKWWFISIIYKNKNPKFINIRWFKKITKKISKIWNIKFIWKIPEVYNLDGIKEFIISKIDKESKEEVLFILNKLNEEKLLHFFWLLKN